MGVFPDVQYADTACVHLFGEHAHNAKVCVHYAHVILCWARVSGSPVRGKAGDKTHKDSLCDLGKPLHCGMLQFSHL